MSSRYKCKADICNTFSSGALDADGNRVVELSRFVGNLMFRDVFSFSDMATTCADVREDIDNLAIDDERYRPFVADAAQCPFKFLETLGIPKV
jgi:hypothetical protein